MKIGIDAKFASSRYGGLGTYTVNIIKTLAALQQDEIVAFVPAFLESSHELAASPSGNIRLEVIDANEEVFDDFFAFRVHWEQSVLPAQLEVHEIDIFFNPAFMAPLAWPGPKVVTVHDLLFERSRDYNPAPSTAYYLQWARRCAEQASAIITVSHTTATDVRALWQIEHIPVTPIHIAPTLAFVPEDPEASRAIVQAKLGIRAPYLLFVGNSFPRKNLQRLIEAYSLLPPATRRALRLVLVTARTDHLTALLTAQGIAEQTTVTGYCNPDLLPHVYRAATMLVFPSLFEGFGLPALEAMQCELPVIVSNTAALPEIVADAALLIDPYNRDEIKVAIESLLHDEELRSRLVLRGKERVQHFSWARTAEETRKILVRALLAHSGPPL